MHINYATIVFDSDDFDGNETDDIDQESCEANGPGYDWWEAYCTQATYTKQ